jgi:hypothetical protein
VAETAKSKAAAADAKEASKPADGSDQPKSLEQQGTQDADKRATNDDPAPDESPAAGVAQLPDSGEVEPDKFKSPEWQETHGHNPLEQNRGDY